MRVKSATYKAFLPALSAMLVGTIGFLPGVGLGDTLNVAVAANFMPAMERIQTEFERHSGHRLQLIPGSSGRHYAQIISGAPFQLFLSADRERPQALERDGRIAPSQRRAYASGRLALWSRDPERGLDPQALTSLGAEEKLAIANPRLAPYGAAAVETLQSLGLYARLQSQLVMGENVAQTFQFAYSGNAALALVAYSQVLAMPESGSYQLIDEKHYSPIVQELVLLAPDNAAALQLFEFLTDPAIASLLEEAGYFLPPKL